MDYSSFSPGRYDQCLQIGQDKLLAITHTSNHDVLAS